MREGNNGILGIATLCFERQHRPTLGGDAQQAEDASAIRHDSLAVNQDFRLERVGQLHKLVGDSQVQSKQVANANLAAADWVVLSHGNRLQSVASLLVSCPRQER